MADYTLTIRADSGYESTTEGRCNADQYAQAIGALHGRQDAELAALRAECASLREDLARHKSHIRLKNDIITNHCIAMQSALIDQHHKGHEAGMAWIGNTLFGPGLIPDIGEALALSKTDPAQAWFDAKTAEHEAMRAKQDAERAALAAQAQEPKACSPSGG